VASTIDWVVRGTLGTYPTDSRKNRTLKLKNSKPAASVSPLFLALENIRRLISRTFN
jgi:hypothetical protein